MIIKTEFEMSKSLVSSAIKKGSFNTQNNIKIPDYNRNVTESNNLKTNNYWYKTSFPDIKSKASLNNPKAYLLKTEDLIPDGKY